MAERRDRSLSRKPGGFDSLAAHFIERRCGIPSPDVVPELPDITVYVESLRDRVVGEVIRSVRIISPFVVRSVEPPMDGLVGRRVAGVRRLGKRVVLVLDENLFVVIHLMIAGRLLWKKPGARLPGRITLLAFEFAKGILVLTEAGSKKRAAVHVVAGERGLAAHDRGGVEVLEADRAAFRDALLRENHTVKRALTDPRLFSGIGNAYSDEILHAARLSPLQLTTRLSEDEVDRLYRAARTVLSHWIDVLREEFAGRFPGRGDITAFRPEFAAHGRFGKPCPDCGSPIQRIRYASNETDYCPRCQTGGRILADRSLSRLLKNDRPRSIDEL